MTILYYFVLILHLIACFFLIAVVLLQQGKGQDLASAFGGGGTQAAFGPRGSVTLLSRITTGLAAVFMITSITLAVIKDKEASVLDRLPTAPSPTPAAAPTNILGAPVTSGSPSPAAAPSASPASASPAPATSSPAAASPATAPAASPAASPKPSAPAPSAQPSVAPTKK